VRKREESDDRGAAEGEPSFDERLARLEAIVAELEKGEISLEPAIARYQEGVLLLKSCRGLLEGFRKQVEVLSADAEGSATPYADDPDVRPGKAGS
jgi:exodeoxyribonuclease VII small subunit